MQLSAKLDFELVIICNEYPLGLHTRVHYSLFFLIEAKQKTDKNK